MCRILVITEVDLHLDGSEGNRIFLCAAVVAVDDIIHSLESNVIGGVRNHAAEA